MDTIWKILLVALVGTLFIFMEVLACVLYHNFAPLYILIPAALTPIPAVLLQLGGSDDPFGSSPRGLHWAQFASSFLGSGLVAVPILLHTTGTIELEAMGLSLGGFALLAASFGVAAYLQRRGDDETLLGIGA
mmetsp:Transcript_6629/g.15374  ORF Transcript_6629/g.15374 Transcript_6629/m.15374 type:complete len:133 (-) Transcript_6629:358-756(-)